MPRHPEDPGLDHLHSEAPGSAPARAHGCICSVANNARGNAASPLVRGEGWTIQPGCPIHDCDKRKAA